MPFNEVLQKWKGRHFLQEEIEKQGFCVHLCYQDHVRKFCQSEHMQCDIDIYWDAIADEYIRSCVRVESNLRKFDDPPVYRSEYLDILWSKYGMRKSIFPAPCLDPCLFTLIERDEENGLAFMREVREIGELRKRGEVLSRKLNSNLWDGKVSGLRKCTESVAFDLGFERVDPRRWDSELSRNGYYKSNSNGMVFFFGFAEGARSLGFGQLPIYFGITHQSESVRNIYLEQFGSIVPGYEWYSVFSNPETAVLGINALVGIFDAMVTSFSN